MRRLGVIPALAVLGVFGHLAIGQERKAFPEECRSYLESRRWKLADVYGALDWKHGGKVNTVAVSPDGKLALSGGLDGSVHLFALPSGKWVRALHDGSSWIESVGFLPEGKLAFSADVGGTIRIFDVVSGKQVRSFGAVGESFSEATPSPDGKQLVAVGGARAGALHVYDVSNGREVAQHAVGKQPSRVAVSPDGKLAAIADGDHVLLVELSSGKEVATLAGPKGTYVASLAFSPGGKTVLTGHGNGTIQLWDLAAASAIASLQAHGGRVEALQFVTDDLVATGSDDYSFKLFSLKSGKELASFSGQAVDAIAVLPDKNRILTGSHHHGLMLWDLDAKKALGEVVGHRMELFSVLHCPDGRRALACSRDHVCRAWDLATGRDDVVLKETIGMSSPCISKDGKRVLIPGYDDVKLVDLASRKVTSVLPQSKDVQRIWFSADGAKAVGLQGSALTEWDLNATSAPKVLRDYEEKMNFIVALEPTGRWALFTSRASDEGQSLALWDLTTAQEVRHVAIEEVSLHAIAVSRDGKRAVTATLKGDVSLWDLDAGTSKPLKGHSRAVTVVAFAPDQKHAITASDDHTIRTFELESGGEVDSIDLSSSGDHATTFDVSEDGRSLLVGTFRGLLLRFTRK
jgi:WD40 repeat protein